MSFERFSSNAAAEYFSNVARFIGIGENKKLSRRDIYHIKQKYPKVEQWYQQLGSDGRQRVDNYLEHRYG